MTAALAFYTDVHPHSDDLPTVRSTWMLLFHFYNIMQLKSFGVHTRSPS